MRPTAIVLLLSVVWIFVWYRILLTSAVLPSVDLPAHIALSELFIEQWRAGRIQFYDLSSYTGWPAMTFDGFLPYLITGALSLVCGWISEAPVRLAAHLLLLLGVSLLPCSLFYAARPLVRERAGEGSFALACVAGTFGFWFLNHDQQYYGIGAAAPMNIGLYPQLFGWHLFLLLSGALFRLIDGEIKMRVAAALLLALLALTHLQTFIFAVFLLLFAAIYFYDLRRPIFTVIFVGILTAGIYLAPCLSLLGEFTAYDVHRPKGDLVQLLLRYPLYNLLLVFRGALGGQMAVVDPMHVLVPLLLLTALAVPSVRTRPAFNGLAIFILLATLLLSSGFVASSLPFGFHYYRFLGYLFILSIVLVTATLSSLLGSLSSRPLRAVALTGVALIGASIALLPHPERARLYAKVDASYLADEKAILEQLAELNSRGRVYVEHITDYKRFAPLSVHFIASRAYLDTGFESLANTFLQRSLAYRIFVESARLLGAKTYNVPLLFSRHASLNDETKLAQLRSFGVTHIVAGTDRFKGRLENAGVPRINSIGRYSIYALQPAPYMAAERVTKIVVGYVDESGTLPFRFLEYYFQGNQELYSRYTLIELRKNQPIPKDVAVVVVNSLASPAPEGVPHLQLRYQRKHSIDHYRPTLPTNLELDSYRDVERYLSDVAGLAYSLSVVTKDRSVAVSGDAPVVTWERGNQSVTLDRLEPGALYRLNNSYFPFWRSEEAELYRGSEERMFVVPSQRLVTLRYSWWNHRSALIGLGMSGAGLFSLLFMWRTRVRVF